ncbi:hypothetical protein niasHS_011084 [Heterodera schachtii]|uniref:RNA helicase n=1 Tax=Heterodera schachtii TaxID=97005 RepID=A0ABD2IYK0_HETSC
MSFSSRQNFGERHPLIGADRYFNDRLTNRAFEPANASLTSSHPSSPSWDAPHNLPSLFDDMNINSSGSSFGQGRQNVQPTTARPLNENVFASFNRQPHITPQGNGFADPPRTYNSSENSHQNGSSFSSAFQRHGSNEYQIDEGPPSQQPPPEQRKRRQKYLPPTRPDVELFNDKNHIQPGAMWEQQFGVGNDTNLSVSCEDGNNSNDLVQKFEECGFSEAIMRNIELRKYKALTQIQKSVIPVILKRRNDLMAHAQTGSGKSAAFLLPIINQIQSIKEKLGIKATNSDAPYALVIEPTKELSSQLFEDARSFAINTGVSVQRTYGDMPMRESRRLIASGCDICAVTCGRLLHFVMEGTIKLENLRFLVLDEADKLLTCDHFNQCIAQLKGSPTINPSHRVLMFSATFDITVQNTASNFLRNNYIFITVGKLNSAVETIDQQFIEVQKYSKQDKLLEMLKTDAIWRPRPNGDPFLKPAKKTLIFVETKRNSDRLAIALTQEKFYNTQSLNSDRTLEQRHLAVRKFIQGQYDILVSTDVAARGINIPNVEHVINYDLPEKEIDTYIHRIGRTGRAGNTGLATSFFDPTSPEDLAHGAFYVEVLLQGRLPVPDFLRRFGPDFLDWANAPNFNNSSRGPCGDASQSVNGKAMDREETPSVPRHNAQNNNNNVEEEEVDSFWSVKEDELVWGR